MTLSDLDQLALTISNLRDQPSKQSLSQLLSLPAFADLQEKFSLFVCGMKSALAKLRPNGEHPPAVHPCLQNWKLVSAHNQRSLHAPLDGCV